MEVNHKIQRTRRQQVVTEHRMLVCMPYELDRQVTEAAGRLNVSKGAFVRMAITKAMK